MKTVLLLALALTASSIDALKADEFPGMPDSLKTVTIKYLVIQQKLAADSFDGVSATAEEMKSAMDDALPQTYDLDFENAVDALVAAPDLHTARLAFQQVSNSLIAELAENRVGTRSLHVVFCPMRRAYWVQADATKVQNPYYGPALLDCGEFQKDF